MLLTEIQIKQALEKAKTAFPKLTDWEFNNEENGEYFGFSMWGKCVIDPETTMPKSFFITLDTYEQSWSGHFTTGQHSYLWSSTDEEDAYLLGTESHKSLEDAISNLKVKIAELFGAFSIN
ncbi:MAG: hypothetical protein SAK29_02620 [Scytonema sp. PMC 1069.18]|nr:hypothetical protein [Scytonema sp. PMC 1069.18]MEC4882789.1 hypothetical protein [Scytonema sp. PMC 1070.18]